MEYRSLGRTGLRLSAIGFGCGAIGGLLVRGEPAEGVRAVALAVERGITYFDTAPSYGAGRSEENLGRILRELRPEGIHIGTKVNLTRDEITTDPAGAIRASLEASLRRLGRDHVDIFYLHNRIVAGEPTAERAVSVEEVRGPIAAGMQAVQQAGLTRFLGFTGLGDTEAVTAVATGGLFDAMQGYYNVLNPSGSALAGASAARPDRQDFAGVINRAAAAGVGVVAIRIFAAGAVSGRLERHPVAGDPSQPLTPGGEYSADVERARMLAPLVGELGLEAPEELALRFVLANRNISTALVGISEVAHLEAVLRWVERGPLDANALARIARAL